MDYGCFSCYVSLFYFPVAGSFLMRIFTEFDEIVRAWLDRDSPLVLEAGLGIKIALSGVFC